MSTADLSLKTVRGPSAVGSDWRRFWRLTWIISKKDYKLTYFGSVLGYIWSLMQPLLFFGVLYVVFAVIVTFNKGVPDFPVLLLMNIVLFGFFQGATGASVASVVIRENLVRKMSFPRLVIPVSTVVTASINLFFNLGVAYAEVQPPRKNEAIQQLQSFSKIVCRGAAAARYADQCSQAQEFVKRLGGTVQ